MCGGWGVDCLFCHGVLGVSISFRIILLRKRGLTALLNLLLSRLSGCLYLATLPHDTLCSQGRSRISGKGFHMYNSVGFALLILSHFS